MKENSKNENTEQTVNINEDISLDFTQGEATESQTTNIKEEEICFNEDKPNNNKKWIYYGVGGVVCVGVLCFICALLFGGGEHERQVEQPQRQEVQEVKQEQLENNNIENEDIQYQEEDLEIIPSLEEITKEGQLHVEEDIEEDDSTKEPVITQSERENVGEQGVVFSNLEESLNQFKINVKEAIVPIITATNANTATISTLEMLTTDMMSVINSQAMEIASLQNKILDLENLHKNNDGVLVPCLCGDTKETTESNTDKKVGVNNGKTGGQVKQKPKKQINQNAIQVANATADLDVNATLKSNSKHVVVKKRPYSQTHKIVSITNNRVWIQDTENGLTESYKTNDFLPNGIQIGKIGQDAVYTPNGSVILKAMF